MENRQFKILAIDDMADNLLVLKAIMAEMFPQAEFLMAESGSKGLELCQAALPDVVLLDIIMPLMDGFEVCKAIKNKPETQHIPVVMVTAAHTDAGLRTKALENGADGFLSKPVDETELKAQVQAMLRLKIAEDHKKAEMQLLEQLISDRTQMLEKELAERRLTEVKLREAVAGLEQSKLAALNLMEDLREEMNARSMAQETLSTSEERFRLVFENSPLGMVSFDNKGVITACNNLFVSIIGSSPERLIGLDMLQLPDKKLVEALKKTLSGESGFYEGLYHSVTADKATWVKVQFAPIFDKEAKVQSGLGLVDDVTEQVKAETEKKAFEERFKKSFFSSPVAISITRPDDAMYIEVNDAYAQLTGYSREQIVGRTVFDLGVIQTETRKHLLNEIKQNHLIKGVLIPIKTRVGEDRLVQIYAEPYELDGVNYILSTLIDVTEQKSYEQELIKLTRAVEQSPVSIVITDLEGTIEYVNPKVVETTGYSPSELIGNNPRVLNSGEKSRDEYVKMYESLTRGEVWTGEFHNKRKNGELYWEHATISPVINDEGIMTHYVAVKEDVTQTKLMQQELVDNESLYRTIFEGNPVPMWVYDVESLRFLEVNEKAIIDYGYSREEFLSLTLKDIRPPEDIPALMENLASHHEAAQGPGLWRHLTKKGDLLTVEVSSHALPPIGGKQRRMVMAYNVTEKEAAQQALQKAKELAEKSDKLKTTFLNNISHEVRTPLNGILGATTLLNDPELSKEDLPELLEIINMSTSRLIQTVTDYMDISLLTSGTMEKELKMVKVMDIIDRLAGKMQFECEKKGLAFNTDTPSEAAVHQIETDSELLTKALGHLLSNAIKFTLKGSVTFGYRIEGSHFNFFVKDTGVGIDASMHEKVFENFSQEDSGSSRRFEGSGLGLSIVKGICEKLGGTVKLKSEREIGSEFTIILPFKQETVKPRATNEAQKRQVLIAEDEDSNFIVLEMILRKAFKAEILRATNGEEAVELASTHPQLSMVIMDIKMPIMDGFEATRQIKAIYPKLPVVAITAFAMSGDERKALEAGCDGYIPKPINRNDLFRVMSEFGFEA